MAAVLPLPRSTPLPRLAGDADWMLACGVAIAVMAVALFNPALLNDGDTAWHLAAGDWMLRHGQVPTVDVFSYTVAGKPWQAHEWLSEVLMALAFRLGGWAGLVSLFAAALGAAVMLLAASLRRSLTGIGLVLALALVLACAAPNLLARPHVLALPVLIAWTGALLEARRSDRSPPLAAAGLMLLWANLHGSFVFGFPLLGAFALEALLEAAPTARWPVARAWGLFGLASLVAACLTPQGPLGLLFPFKLMSMASLAGVEEWRASDFSAIGPFEISLLAGLFICLSRGVKLPPVRLLLLLGLMHMALQHNRHVMILAAVGALLLAPAVAAATGQVETQRRPLRAAVWWAPLIAVLALFGARAAIALDRGDGPTMPMSAIDHVPPTLRERPVLNAYGFGGALILRGVRPFVDGRTDLYGDAFMGRYYRIAGGDPAALDAALKQYAVAWTILPPGHPLVALMDAKPGWRRLYADRYAVVHARVAPGP
jgi:hypothetical protein